MSQPGWYPDPAGAPGRFRYWDGATWSPTTTDAPGLTPTPTPAASGPQLTRPSAPPPTYLTTGRPTPGPAPRGRSLAWLLGVGVVIVALIWAGTQLLGSLGFRPFGGGPAPVSNPTSNPCPTQMAQSIRPTFDPITPDGRVRGGNLSYPLLGDPWSPPDLEDRLAFGHTVYTQVVTTEANFQPGANWVASVLIGELVAGDGFFSPRAGAEMIAKCATGDFYSDAVVQRTDKVSQAITVSGKAAWLLEFHLAFDIEGLNEKGETAIFVIVQTGENTSSAFYASIPDSRPDLLADARRVQGELRYEP